MNIEVKIKLLNKNAKLPLRSSTYAAGYDLFACVDEKVVIKAHETVKIPTGLSFELPNECVGLIYARSGLSTKKGLAPANKVGVCDSDYRGEYIVALHNHSNIDVIIEPGERIAQLVFVPFYSAVFKEVESLSDTQRGDGGFGSTGK